MKKLIIVAALALLVPSLALAGGKPANPGKSTAAHAKPAPTVMYVLKGTLTNYVAATSTTPGLVAIDVKAANHHGKTMVSHSFTFQVTTKTKIAGTYRQGDRGIVKVRGLKSGLGADTTTIAAFQVIDQGAPKS